MTKKKSGMKLKRNNRHHKKYVLPGIVILLLAATTCTTFALVKNQSGAKTPSAAADLSQQDFVMIATTGLSYRATILTTYNGERPDRTTIMDRDGKNGASRFTSKVNDEITATVYSGEVTYSCDRQACEKMIWRDDSAYADNTAQLAYDFTANAIQQLKRRVTYKGEADCPAGRCLVWEAAPDDTSLQQYSQTLYIDKRTKSISKVVRTYTSTKYTNTISYDYQPRTITLPPVPQEIPEL